MAHLYISDELAETAVGATVELAGAEARHAVSVSRLRVGESVLITNGRGLLVDAEAVEVGKDRVSLVVASVDDREPQQPPITLVQALAKGDRDERAIEMATELGVSDIVPWQSARSVSRWEGDKALKGQARWQAIVREASKQSIRAWIPRVETVTSTKSLISGKFDGLTLVLDPSGEVALSHAISEHTGQASSGIRLVVGPEGGIAPEEIDQLVSSGAVVVGLGANILRTSTAGPAVLAVINELLSRW